MKLKQRRHRRPRCLGHIINLRYQTFLMGRNCKKYLAKLEKTLPMRRLYEYGTGRALKKLGCLHQLHNLVRHNTSGLLHNVVSGLLQ
jgi:hypothetical protein